MASVASWRHLKYPMSVKSSTYRSSCISTIEYHRNEKSEVQELNYVFVIM